MWQADGSPQNGLAAETRILGGETLHKVRASAAGFLTKVSYGAFSYVPDKIFVKVRKLHRTA